MYEKGWAKAHPFFVHSDFINPGKQSCIVSGKLIMVYFLPFCYESRDVKNITGKNYRL